MTKSDPLADEPFSYTATRDGKVQIYCRGKLAKTLKGREASRFGNRIESADAPAAQLLMARVTGQFKFGNERQGKLRGK